MNCLFNVHEIKGCDGSVWELRGSFQVGDTVFNLYDAWCAFKLRPSTLRRRVRLMKKNAKLLGWM